MLWVATCIFSPGGGGEGGALPFATTPTLAGAWGRVLALRPRGCAWRGKMGKWEEGEGRRTKKKRGENTFKRRISKKKIMINIERKEENKKEEDG